MKPAHIYILIDPRSDEIRYVGKSIRPEQRLQNHMNERSNCHRSHWLQQLKSAGLTPRMEIVETVIGEWPWQESEKRWIAKLAAMGARLTNNTAGGDGVCNLPPETRARVAATWRGRKHRPESLVKIGVASRGRRHTEERRSLMSAKMTGRKIHWVGKVAAALRKLTAEDLATIRARFAAGARTGELAREYGVHRTTMSKVKLGTYETYVQKSRSKGGAL